MMEGLVEAKPAPVGPGVTDGQCELTGGRGYCGSVRQRMV